jgi:iron transport multicopper oxidase
MKMASTGKSLKSIYSSVSLNLSRALINNQTYVSQKVPSLYTALSAPAAYVMNPAIYGVAVNPFVVKYNQV